MSVAWAPARLSSTSFCRRGMGPAAVQNNKRPSSFSDLLIIGHAVCTIITAATQAPGISARADYPGAVLMVRSTNEELQQSGPKAKLQAHCSLSSSTRRGFMADFDWVSQRSQWLTRAAHWNVTAWTSLCIRSWPAKLCMCFYCCNLRDRGLDLR